MVSLRQRNRINAMRHTQRVALPMFINQGFDSVTVSDIATEVEVAASTIYRHFDTKEAIVLWDEHDAAIDEALTHRLEKNHPALPAIRDVFVETLGARYHDDLEFQLQRIKYIYATEQLHAAAVEADFSNRAELIRALEHFLSKKHKSAAGIIAGSALLALDVAMDEWQKHDAKKPLSSLIATAFDQLEHLGELA